MKINITSDTLFSILYWALYLGLGFVSLWVSSGVVQHYLSNITSFSQSVGTCEDRPVISIVFMRARSGVDKLHYDKNVYIKYCPGYSSLWRYNHNHCKTLKAKINKFALDNKIEKVFLARNTDYRIIPMTKLSRANLNSTRYFFPKLRGTKKCAVKN